jgi:hypothetical protein
MKKIFHIHLKKGGTIKFEAVKKFTSDTYIKVIDYFEKETKCLYLRIEHNQLNTILDLTNVAPYTILFNKNFGFESATFNNNEIAETPFLLSTQYKQVIFIPSFMNFTVNDILLHTFIYCYEKEYEESNKEDLKENWYEHRLFLNGYGKFPYIILKTGYAIFMQIPIHFNANGDFDNYPGTSLDGISEDLILEYRKDITSELHDKIIEHCKWVKSKIEAKRIWLNLELAKKPSNCLEYIIIHEMIHLLERNHNTRFVALMNKFMPNWKEVKDDLNRLPVSHTEWGYNY